MPDISLNNNTKSPNNDSNLSKSYDKVDVSVLTIEDKEKILKLMFQKMNSGAPPKNWRQ